MKNNIKTLQIIFDSSVQGRDLLTLREEMDSYYPKNRSDDPRRVSRISNKLRAIKTILGLPNTSLELLVRNGLLERVQIPEEALTRFNSASNHYNSANNSINQGLWIGRGLIGKFSFGTNIAHSLLDRSIDQVKIGDEEYASYLEIMGNKSIPHYHAISNSSLGRFDAVWLTDRGACEAYDLPNLGNILPMLKSKFDLIDEDLLEKGYFTIGLRSILAGSGYAETRLGYNPKVRSFYIQVFDVIDNAYDEAASGPVSVETREVIREIVRIKKSPWQTLVKNEFTIDEFFFLRKHDHDKPYVNRLLNFFPELK